MTNSTGPDTRPAQGAAEVALPEASGSSRELPAGESARGPAPSAKASLGTRLAGRLLSSFVGLVDRTSTTTEHPHDFFNEVTSEGPVIFAFWHGQFMMLSAPAGARDRPLAAMVARHKDAELVGEVVSRFGVGLIRGAGAGDRRKDRGGASALRASVRALRAGTSICMTADVPPGPARRVGEGIIEIARLSGRPIIPIAAASSRFHVLKTWSRMTINLPFSDIVFVGAPAITVPRDAGPELREELRRNVQSELDRVTTEAYRHVGRDAGEITPNQLKAPGAPAPAIGMRLRTYRGLTALARPLAPFILSHREKRGKELPARRNERLGRPVTPRPGGALLWVHAASVGETNTVLPVIDALTRARPGLNVLLTTGTVTSAGLVAERMPERVIHQFVPLDTARFAGRFLDHWKPDLAVLTESEIWPNLIIEAANRQIPINLVNARMSARSRKRWRKQLAIAEPLFGRLDLVLAQDRRTASWFHELGARHVEAVGNLKIDAPPPPVDIGALEDLQTALGGRPRFVAASTHDGEETVIARAHRLLRDRCPGLLTVIAPRHPERGVGISEDLKKLGLKVRLRSTGQLPDASTDVYIADTIGELGTLYRLTDVAFIGGTLIDHGGQNPVEAIRHGSAVLAGPSRHNFTPIYTQLEEARAVVTVNGPEDIAEAITGLLANEPSLAELKNSSAKAVDQLSGALPATVAALLDELDRRTGVQTSATPGAVLSTHDLDLASAG